MASACNHELNFFLSFVFCFLAVEFLGFEIEFGLILVDLNKEQIDCITVVWRKRLD